MKKGKQTTNRLTNQEQQGRKTPYPIIGFDFVHTLVDVCFGFELAPHVSHRAVGQHRARHVNLSTQRTHD